MENMKSHHKMLMELSEKNLINTIDVMEYAERLGTNVNPYIRDSVQSRIESLYQQRISNRA